MLVHTCLQLWYKLITRNSNIKIFYVLIVDGITRGEGTPQRPRKQLDLPVLPSMMQQRNQDGGEIESKLQEEIMKMNGILSINGKVCNYLMHHNCHYLMHHNCHSSFAHLLVFLEICLDFLLHVVCNYLLSFYFLNVSILVGALFQNFFQYLVLIFLVVDWMHSAICLMNFISLAVILVLSFVFIF